VLLYNNHYGLVYYIIIHSDFLNHSYSLMTTIDIE
jgi:hypothetical protein